MHWQAGLAYLSEGRYASQRKEVMAGKGKFARSLSKVFSTKKQRDAIRRQEEEASRRKLGEEEGSGRCHRQHQHFDEGSENDSYYNIDEIERNQREVRERLEKQEKQLEKQEQEIMKILKNQNEIQEQFKKQEKQIVTILQNQNEIKAALVGVLQNQKEQEKQMMASLQNQNEAQERFQKQMMAILQDPQKSRGSLSTDISPQKPRPTQIVSLSTATGVVPAHQLRQTQQKPSPLVSKAATGKPRLKIFFSLTKNDSAN